MPNRPKDRFLGVEVPSRIFSSSMTSRSVSDVTASPGCARGAKLVAGKHLYIARGQARRCELPGMLHVGGRKDMRGSAILDLLAQEPRGAKYGAHPQAAVRRLLEGVVSRNWSF